MYLKFAFYPFNLRVWFFCLIPHTNSSCMPVLVFGIQIRDRVPLTVDFRNTDIGIIYLLCCTAILLFCITFLCLSNILIIWVLSVGSEHFFIEWSICRTSMFNKGRLNWLKDLWSSELLSFFKTNRMCNVFFGFSLLVTIFECYWPSVLCC